jgi:hypothetical protein
MAGQDLIDGRVKPLGRCSRGQACSPVGSGSAW